MSRGPSLFKDAAKRWPTVPGWRTSGFSTIELPGKRDGYIRLGACHRPLTTHKTGPSNGYILPLVVSGVKSGVQTGLSD